MNATNQSDLSNFETATIVEGGEVDVVFRRRSGPAIMDQLDYSTRQAVDLYISVAEGVLAGGATMPRDSLSVGCTGGAPSKEGRQSSALDQVRFLRHLEKAVGDIPIPIGRVEPRQIAPLILWRRVCLGDASMAQILGLMKLKPAKTRVADLNAAFIAIATRVADAIGRDRAPR